MKKTVVITGASSGLGKEIARIYRNKGYQLILSGRNEKGLEEFHRDSTTKLVFGDLVQQATQNSIVAAVKAKGRVDILISNAGITSIQPFETVEERQISELIEINLISSIKLTRLLYPLMQKQKSGHIVFVNSSAGKEPKIYHTLYCAAKFGLSGFAQTLRLEAKKYNIRVTSFHPGGVKTNLYDHLENPPDISQFMDPVKVAEVLVYLTETEGISPDEIVINRLLK